jgi:hypothetical protein
MAIIVKCGAPDALLASIKKAINANTVQTWAYDDDGDFTHDVDQWRKEAWLRPKVYAGELRFGILAPKDVVLTDAVRGVYHGRFIEMLVTHFKTDFTMAVATAAKYDPDFQ